MDKLTWKETSNIKRICDNEKESKQLLCDFENDDSDLILIALETGHKIWWDDDGILQFDDKEVVQLALDYYYEQHPTKKVAK